uniref:Replication protein A 70 kDa DNA-binding subunit B/D first OB fold domain-containing protein n=1 Tax=Noccaea caerulescens TaxID=107243 RepID=A0A1J3F4X7_NOCCA
MWEARDFRRNNTLLSVDCLLLDEKSTAIQASIHPRRLHKFRNKLEEGKLFKISVFDVKKNQHNYRLSDNAYKIYFSDKTAMDEVESDKYSIPTEYFRIRPFKDIEVLADKGESLPDVVVQISSIRTIDKLANMKSPPKKTFNLVLTCTFDSGESAFISVWEKHAL